MANKILTNLPALKIQENLRKTRLSLDKSIERMASGSKVNESADDPFAYSKSERLRAQLRGVIQSKNNASEGVSLLQVADSSLEEVQNILIRMRELALGAANNIMGSEERSYINREYISLREELKRIQKATSYNEIDLLGGQNKDISIQVNLSQSEHDEVKLDMQELKISTKEWGFDKISIDNTAQAKLLIPNISKAMNDVLNQRATLGTAMNRLESTMTSLSHTVENLKLDQSDLIDVDVASESIEFTKKNILMKAGISILAQTRNLSDMALKLLEK